MTDPLFIFVIILILAGEFVNGWTDAPNAIATVISTRVMPPKIAVIMASVLNVAGVLVGTAVATTIGKGIVKSDSINLETIAAAMVGIVVWSSVAAHFGIPTSESHALVAGLAGAALATAGPEALIASGWQKVIWGILLASIMGFSIALLISKFVRKAFSASSPAKSKKIFNRLQIFSAAFMAFNHGSNDGQKFIGVFALALVLGGIYKDFFIPLWVIMLCAITMGIGTSIGGLKIIKKLGMNMTNLEPWQGFSAEIGASLTILGASFLGIPLSTTQTITTSIMGVGASRGMEAVRWGISREIVVAWLLTFPVCGAIAYSISFIFGHL